MKNNGLSKNLYSLAIPILIEMLFMVTVGIVDTIMITQYNSDAVGSIANANTIINFLLVFINVVSIGTGIVISNHLGAKNTAFAKNAIYTGIIFNLIVGLSICLVFQFFGNDLLHFIDVSPKLYDDASAYLKIVTLGIPLQSVTVVLSAALRSNSKPKYMTMISLMANIINALLNLILIFDLLGTNNPNITGVNGAAIATLISYIFSFICACIVATRVLKLRIKEMEINTVCIKQVLRIGLPSALEYVVYNLSQILVLKAVNNIDETDISVLARTYILTISAYIFQFSAAFSSANQVIIGYELGEGDIEGAYKQTYKTFRTSLIYMFIMCTIVVLVGRPFFNILTDNQEAINLAIAVLPIVYVLEFGRNINITFINALKGAGDTVFPLIMAIISMLIIAAGGSWLFAINLKMGLIGVFIGCCLDEIIRGITMLIRWKSHVWTKKTLIKYTKKQDELEHE